MLPSEINSKAGKKKALYSILANRYYLPAYKSKAITKSYLASYTLKIIPIFFLFNQKVVRNHYRFKVHNTSDLLEILENALAERGMKPTGLNQSTLPDSNWISDAILSLDANDPYKLLSTRKNKQDEEPVELNDESFYILDSITYFF